MIENLKPLRRYCEQHSWPKLTQFNHWIYTKHPIAVRCVKKIGSRYLLDVMAFEDYVRNATLEEGKPQKPSGVKS